MHERFARKGQKWPRFGIKRNAARGPWAAPEYDTGRSARAELDHERGSSDEALPGVDAVPPIELLISAFSFCGSFLYFWRSSATSRQLALLAIVQALVSS